MFSTATKESAKITKDFAARDIKNAANDANYSAKSALNSAEAAGHNVVDDIASYANQAGHKVRQFIDDAGDELTQASDRVTTEIRANPVRSTFVALGVGFLLGALARR